MTDHEPRHRADEQEPPSHPKPGVAAAFRSRLKRPEEQWGRLDNHEPRHAAPTVVDETW
jgi:hypothetical protein